MERAIAYRSMSPATSRGSASPPVATTSWRANQNRMGTDVLDRIGWIPQAHHVTMADVLRGYGTTG